MTSTTRAVGYTRVSTGRQAESGLGLDDQRQVIEQACSRRGWDITRWTTDAGASAKTLRRRPGLAEALETLDAGDADVLIVAKLDRLSRSVADFAALTERAHKGRWSLVVLDIDVDSSTPAGELTVNVIASAAQYERRIISERVKAAHRQLAARGHRSGRRPQLDNATRQRIAAERDDGLSYGAIADGLNNDGVPTVRGGPWTRSTVVNVVKSVALDERLTAAR